MSSDIEPAVFVGRAQDFSGDDDKDGWWKTFRSILLTTGQIALKVLPILLASIERANRGEPPGEPELVLSTGPVDWFVDHSAATVTTKNVDPLHRDVTLTVTPGTGGKSPSQSFILAAGETQTLDRDIWRIIAEGTGGGEMSVAVSPSPSEDAPEQLMWHLVTFDHNDPKWKIDNDLAQTVVGNEAVTVTVEAFMEHRNHYLRVDTNPPNRLGGMRSLRLRSTEAEMSLAGTHNPQVIRTLKVPLGPQTFISPDESVQITMSVWVLVDT